MARKQFLSVGDMTLEGTLNSAGITVFTYDGDRNALLCAGSASAPSSAAGYAVGCLYLKSSGTAYVNNGTAASCTFEAIGSISAGSVELADLAAGVTPSHVVKFGGTITWSGSGASKATTVTGVAATDLVLTTFLVNPTQAASILKAVPTTNTITITLSAANTSNDAQISYVVYRAAA